MMKFDSSTTQRTGGWRRGGSGLATIFEHGSVGIGLSLLKSPYLVEASYLNIFPFTADTPVNGSRSGLLQEVSTAV